MNRGTKDKPSIEVQLQASDDSDFWHNEEALWPFNMDEIGNLEEPVYRWEISKTNTRGRLGQLNNELNKNIGYKGNKADLVNWDALKKKVASEKLKYGSEWQWKNPEHIYSDFGK